MTVKGLTAAALAIGLMVQTDLLADNDSLFSAAQKSVHEGQYAAALHDLDMILAEDSVHVDALLLKGSIFFWTARYDSSRSYINNVLKLSPAYRDALVVSMRLYKAIGNKALAIDVAKQALNRFPQDTLFIVETTFVAPREKPVKKVSETRIRGEGDLFDGISRNKPWGTGLIQQSITLCQTIVVVGLNGASRNYGGARKNGGNVEAEASMPLGQRFHIASGLSFSSYAMTDTLYPFFRGFLGFNTMLPYAWECGATAYYATYLSADNFLLTARIVKYFANLYIAITGYAAPNPKTTFFFGTGDVRLYCGGDDRHWLSIKVGLGKSPYDAGFFSIQEYIFLFGRIDTHMYLGPHWAIEPSCEIRKEQYGFHVPYFRLSTGTGLVYRW